MKIAATNYKFTKGDANDIKALGYDIKTNGKTTIEKIMPSKFPNFNLLSLLRSVETSFSQTTTNKIHRILEFDDAASVLRIQYYNEHRDEEDALVFVREFSVVNKSIQVKHDYCIIPKPYRGQGLIKPVFKESLQQYVNMNAKKIAVHAGLSSGGYAWAKHGFVAINKREVDQILKLAKTKIDKTEFAAIKKIYDIYYAKNPGGKAFPMDLWAAFSFMKKVLMGSDWHGELDLKNQDQFRNFKEYVYG